MKRINQFALITLCFAFVVTAHAQTTTNERIEEVREQANERREAVETAVEERRAALSERLQERITNLAANMSNRFDQVIVRLQNILNRIDSRADKIAAEGKDISEAKAALARAQDALNDAKALMSDIDAKVATVVGSPEPRTEWQNLKRSYTEAKEQIKTAHTELRNALVALKGARIEAANEEPREEVE